MKQKLIALMLVALVTASTFGVAGLLATTPVAALTATKTTLSVSKTTPIVNESVTFTATLTNGTGPLGGLNVTIWHYSNGVRVNDATKKTNATTGKITWVKSWASAGTTTYNASFGGNSAYAKSQSAPVTVTVKIPTTLTLSSDKTSVQSKEQFTVSGYLRDTNNHPLASRVVQFYYQFEGWPATTWVAWKNVTTDSSGHYRLQDYETATIHLYTVFKGDAQYASAMSNLVTVYVKAPTTLTIQMTNNNGTKTTFSGILKTSTGTPLKNYPVTLYRSFNTATVTTVTVMTDQTGRYTIVDTHGEGNFDYFAVFWGDTKYMGSTSPVIREDYLF